MATHRDRFEIVDGDVRIRVEGLRDTIRALNKAGADSQDMKGLMHSMGSIVVDAARPNTPVLSGWLKGTLRAGKGKTKAVVRAGSRVRPYGGVVHYGWPARNIQAQPFLIDALQQNQAHVFREFDRGLEALLRKNKLK